MNARWISFDKIWLLLCVAHTSDLSCSHSSAQPSQCKAAAACKHHHQPIISQSTQCLWLAHTLHTETVDRSVAGSCSGSPAVTQASSYSHKQVAHIMSYWPLARWMAVAQFTNSMPCEIVWISCKHLGNFIDFWFFHSVRVPACSVVHLFQCDCGLWRLLWAWHLATVNSVLYSMVYCSFQRWTARKGKEGLCLQSVLVPSGFRFSSSI